MIRMENWKKEFSSSPPLLCSSETSYNRLTGPFDCTLTDLNNSIEWNGSLSENTNKFNAIHPQLILSSPDVVQLGMYQEEIISEMEAIERWSTFDENERNHHILFVSQTTQRQSVYSFYHLSISLGGKAPVWWPSRKSPTFTYWGDHSLSHRERVTTVSPHSFLSFSFLLLVVSS